MAIQYQVLDRIALITLDRKPVNSLDQATRYALSSALQQAIDDLATDAAVIWGGPRIFSAGADIHEFASGLGGAAYATPTLPEVVNMIDAAPKPVVAAIAGPCLGGALEIALACHARICSLSATFGLPEIKLGLLPGAGGTQRLPRLIGLSSALQLILSGTPIAAQRAHDLGLARIACGDLLEAARGHASSLVGQQLPRASLSSVRLPEGSSAETYFATQKSNLKQPLPAPRACIDAVEAAVARPFPDGCCYEAELFRSLLQTPESKALCYAFLGDRAAGKSASSQNRERSRSINRVGIVGAGTMGTAIAICCLDASIPTTLIDVTAAAVGAGRNRIRSHYASLVGRSRLDASAAAARIQQLTTADDYNALADCNLVIEAVYEDLPLKRAVFTQIDRALPLGGVLASNTSTLDLNEIALTARRPEDVVGLHFFSPANVMRLLEIVRGRLTSPSTLATAVTFARKIAKIPVIAGVCDGFIGNRMFEEYLRQAYVLVDSGLTPYRIDAALARWGMAMGPFAVMDLAGGDIGWAIRKRRQIEHPDRPYSTFPDRVCELKRLGRKTGAGYYAYDSAGRRSEDPLIVELAIDHARAIGCLATDISDEEIVERCVFALVNEGVRILEEGIAERASDIDVVYRNGYGFPAHRGGPLFAAEYIGLDHVLRSMAKFRAGYQGWFWEPAPALVDAWRRGLRLSDLDFQEPTHD